jgi:hypothetical protein
MSAATREIPLTQGYVALIDEDDYADASRFTWSAVKRDDGRCYAQRNIRTPDGRRTTERLHQYLLPGVERVDHKNGDGLDNRRANLRPATNAENGQNRRGLDARNTSGYRGVSWDRRAAKWQARIALNGRRSHLGYFTDPVEAARAFDEAAVRLFGEFAGALNLPDERAQRDVA